MKKSGFFPFFAITLSILLTSMIGIADAKKIIKVQIHTIAGGPITEANLIGQMKVLNAADDPNAQWVIDSNHVHPPGTTPKDPNVNDKGRINIWGLPKCVITGEPNNVSGVKGNIIEIVPGDPPPPDPNAPYVHMKDSSLAHEGNHILLGPEHSNDPNNKMYPDNRRDANNPQLHSCHRKGTQLTPEQRKKINDTNVPYANNAVSIGLGAEIYDVIGDVPSPFIDLDWTQGWIERIHGDYIVHLWAQYDVVSFFDLPTEEGFLINSDGDPMTGEPPEGLDCYLAYNPYFGEIIFQRYDNLGGGWIPQMPPEGVSCELSYTSKDANVPPKASGVRFTVPLNVLLPGPLLTGNFAFKATGRRPDERDFAPDVGLLKIFYPPVPIPGDLNLDNKVDEADLEMMAEEEWLREGNSRADIFPPMGDGVVDFLDYAVLANNWLIGVP